MNVNQAFLKDSKSLSAQWYLVQCKPREGFRAEEHLKNQGFTCFHPTCTVRITHANRKIKRIESLFPHYLFVLLHPEQSIATVNSTRGVSKVVRFGGRLSPVSDALVSELARHCQVLNDRELEPEFKPGDKVTITEGAFQKIETVVKATKGEERVIVLLNLLHKECELEMDAHQIQVVE